MYFLSAVMLLVAVCSSSDSSFGMDVFKRLLQTGPPTMLN